MSDRRCNRGASSNDRMRRYDRSRRISTLGRSRPTLPPKQPRSTPKSLVGLYACSVANMVGRSRMIRRGRNSWRRSVVAPLANRWRAMRGVGRIEGVVRRRRRDGLRSMRGTRGRPKSKGRSLNERPSSMPRYGTSNEALSIPTLRGPPTFVHLRQRSKSLRLLP